MKYRLLKDLPGLCAGYVFSGVGVLLKFGTSFNITEHFCRDNPTWFEELPESQEEAKEEGNCCKCPCRECAEDMPHEHATTNGICSMFCQPQKEECRYCESCGAYTAPGNTTAHYLGCKIQIPSEKEECSSCGSGTNAHAPDCRREEEECKHCPDLGACDYCNGLRQQTCPKPQPKQKPSTSINQEVNRLVNDSKFGLEAARYYATLKFLDQYFTK